jgi:myo-inositol 2-dehydrogenase / D-chiro-inositol 1-dehydrogenase
VELIGRAQDAGLTTFCEKPLASDLAASLLNTECVADGLVPVHIGFQRPFDAGFRADHDAATCGSLGWIHTIRATTNDAAPPPASYLPTSGGFLRDAIIHHFDPERFVTGRKVVSVLVVGQNRGEAFFAEYDDIDAASSVLTMDDGTIALISGSGYHARGYDVRLEALGSKDSSASEWTTECPCVRSGRGWTFPLPCPTPTSWSGSTRRTSMSWSRSPTSSPAGSSRRARSRRRSRPS